MTGLKPPRVGWRIIAAALALLVVPAGCNDADLAAIAPPPTDLPAASDEALLRRELDEAIASMQARRLDVNVNAAWQVVHGLLAFGPDLQMMVDGKPVSALEYIFGGGPMNGWRLHRGEKGLECILEAGSKTGLGHEDQWLGYLSFLDLPADRTIVVGEAKFQVLDLVTQAQWDLYEGMEASWTLMGCAKYLPLDAKWKSKNGEEWTIERIVEMESRQDIVASACGGTHRLTALTVALNKHLAAGGQLTGGWKLADERIYHINQGSDDPVPDGFIERAKKTQNPDGTFSTDYYVRPSHAADLGLQLGTTGHVLEFLANAMSDEGLREPWVVKAAARLCTLVKLTQDIDLECGGFYHAARGLRVYRERRFGPLPKPNAG